MIQWTISGIIKITFIGFPECGILVKEVLGRTYDAYFPST
jgi:hypothetical protein